MDSIRKVGRGVGLGGHVCRGVGFGVTSVERVAVARQLFSVPVFDFSFLVVPKQVRPTRFSHFLSGATLARINQFFVL